MTGYATDLSIRYTSMNDSSGNEPEISRVNLNARFQVAVIRIQEEIGKVRHLSDTQLLRSGPNIFRHVIVNANQSTIQVNKTV